MGYDTRTRDTSRRVVAGVSGALSAAVLVGTGAITGQAARAHHDEERAEQERRAEEYAAWQAEQEAYQAALARSRQGERPVVVRQRPHRTRVSTRYITAAAPSGVSLGSSGSSPRSTGGSPPAAGPRGGGGGGGGGGASGPTPGPPPPPPPPPPPSSSGS